MKPNADLSKFLNPYDDEIQNLAIQLRDFITDLVPEANELIWDNYNAVAIAYSKSEKLADAFCHIAVYAKHVNFGFNQGTSVTKTSIKLNGTGKYIRHIKVTDFDSFPKEAIQSMIWEAVGFSEQMNSDLVNVKAPGKSLVMSVSEKKIRPGT